MLPHTCVVEWSRAGAQFTSGKYSRAHDWRFDGGAVVRASSSPQLVRVPWSDPAAVDPEEALVAAAASCHMLWFLSLAAQQGYVVDRYSDAAEGEMGAFDGRPAVTGILLRPQVSFSGPLAPDDGAVATLHHQAHEHCYIAASLRGTVRVQGGWQFVADPAAATP
jgi:organic hydroperoxide reductase OsmC/OhrA